MSTKISPARRPIGLEQALIPIGIALNLSVGTLVVTLKLPIFVDCLGTMAVTILVGLRAGIIAGALSNLLGSALGLNPNLWAFSGTQVIIAIFTHFAANMRAFKVPREKAVAGSMGPVIGLFYSFSDFFRTYWRTIVWGGAMGIVSATVSAPVAAMVFGGVTGSGTSLFIAVMLKSGQNLWLSVLKAGVVFDGLDKIIQYLLVVWLLAGMPKSLLRRFPGRALRINGFVGGSNARS